MFVSNIRLEFYDVIAGNRVLLLVGCDVDAMCACKILQFLFQCDNVEYTLISVHTKSSLIESFTKYKNQAKYVVMVNCGATLDIIEDLKPPEEIIFFIADSHRPVNVYNIYSESQVRLLMKSDDCENIPHYEDIFKDEEEYDEDEAISNEEMLVKRRERRLWEDNRERLLFEYYQISYYGESSSFLMFDLSWKMSRDNNELLWWAIIGLTEQKIMNKTEHDKYVFSMAAMQGHVTRHNRTENGQINSVSRMKISFEQELNINLYKHWSLYESLINSKYTACKFKLWTFKGKKKLLEFLAEIGLPLTQCKQKFSSMHLDIRNKVCSWMEDMAEKYSLNEIVYGSFIFQFGFSGKFSASDMVLAIHALLESTDKEKTQSDKFLDALYALSRLSKNEVNSIKAGIDLAKDRMIAIFRQVQTFIDMNHVIRTGPFFYAIVPNSTSDIRYFCQPGGLSMLAHYLLEAVVCNSRKRRAESFPLLLFAQDPNDPDNCLVVGIPPFNQTTKNFFGKAFEQAAEQAKIKISQDLFCSTFAYINRNDQGKFLNNLFLLLS